MELEQIVCPVDGCGWCHIRIPPQVAPETLVDVFGVGALAAVAQAMELEDAVLAQVRSHVDGHSPEDYLKTITRLQGRVAELEARDA